MENILKWYVRKIKPNFEDRTMRDWITIDINCAAFIINTLKVCDCYDFIRFDRDCKLLQILLVLFCVLYRQYCRLGIDAMIDHIITSICSSQCKYMIWIVTNILPLPIFMSLCWDLHANISNEHTLANM